MGSQVNRRNFLRFSAMAATAPIFDLKLPRGLDFTLQNSPTPEKYLIETMPGGVALFDYNNDGQLDLFVTRYMEWDTKHSKTCGGAWRTYCPPVEFPATTNLLYRNRGDGTFEDVSQKSGIAAKKGRALGVAFADCDDDGFMDIFVANDGMQQYLFHNNGNRTFRKCALESGAALPTDGKPLSGMGTVFQDYDNDGKPDILVTVLPREIYALYHNNRPGLVRAGSLEAGLGALP